MKISPPPYSYVPSSIFKEDPYLEKLFDECQRAAIRLTIQSGIMVRVMVKPEEDCSFSTSSEIQIVFTATGKSFTTLKEVRRHLKLKAFM